ncbi:MAG: thioredoxin domain-containing protein, partial [Propionibacteriaceae bacterium]
MTGGNRLASATSPYLLQHADNPVQWWPWSDEAFATAAERQVPVFLSVGYAACHWCHVMAHESFEDERTASMINEHFVAIKVDREERPDVDAVYMQATQALTGQGGWPMSVFLTPDRKPFYAGTYFPPTARHGLPSFHQVLQAISEAWRDRKSEILVSASEITRRLSMQQTPAGSEMLTAD